MSENGVGYINSIIRATNILELYNKLDVEYLGLAEISKELDLHKTTVFRVVKRWSIKAGYARKPPMENIGLAPS